MKFSGTTLQRVAVLLFFVYVFLFFLRPVYDPDTPWHLNHGRYIVENQRILHDYDPFTIYGDRITYVGKFILAQGWLSTIIIYLVYYATGIVGLVIFRAIFFLLVFVLLWLLIKRIGRVIALVLLFLIPMQFLGPYCGIRAQMFTTLFTVLFFAIYYLYRKSGRDIWLMALPPMMLLWANLHGGYILGSVLICCVALQECLNLFTHWKEHRNLQRERMRVLCYCGISIAMSLINPNTFMAYVYAIVSQTDESMFYNMTVEYKTPLDAIGLGMMPFGRIVAYGYTLAVSIFLFMHFIRRRSYDIALMLLFSAAISFMAVRYVALFAIVVTSAMAFAEPSRTLTRIAPRYCNVGRTLAAIALIILLANSLSRNPGSLKSFSTEWYPVDAADFLSRNMLTGNIYSSYNLSSYISFIRYPNSKVFMDNRNMNSAVLREGLSISGFGAPDEDYVRSINTALPPMKAVLNAKLGGRTITSRDTAYTDGRPGWLNLLDKAGVDIIVHESINQFNGKVYPMVLDLVASDEWRLVHINGSEAIYLRDIPRFREAIDKLGVPNSNISAEIVAEARKGLERGWGHFYASAALGLLMEGRSDSLSKTLLDKAIELEHGDFVILYLMAANEVLSVETSAEHVTAPLLAE